MSGHSRRRVLASSAALAAAWAAAPVRAAAPAPGISWYRTAFTGAFADVAPAHGDGLVAAGTNAGAGEAALVAVRRDGDVRWVEYFAGERDARVGAVARIGSGYALAGSVGLEDTQRGGWFAVLPAGDGEPPGPPSVEVDLPFLSRWHLRPLGSGTLALAGHAASPDGATTYVFGLDASGDRLWRRRFEDTYALGFLSTDGDGGCLVGGTRVDADSAGDPWVAELTPAGDERRRTTLAVDGWFDVVDAIRRDDGTLLLAGTDGLVEVPPDRADARWRRYEPMRESMPRAAVGSGDGGVAVASGADSRVALAQVAADGELSWSQPYRKRGTVMTVASPAAGEYLLAGDGAGPDAEDAWLLWLSADAGSFTASPPPTGVPTTPTGGDTEPRSTTSPSSTTPPESPTASPTATRTPGFGLLATLGGLAGAAWLRRR